MIQTILRSEVDAYLLLRDAGLLPFDNAEYAYSKAGDLIVELADRIKKERGEKDDQKDCDGG